MDGDSGLLIVGDDIAVFIVDCEVERIESGLVCEQSYEVDGLLQVGPFAISIYQRLVDIDEPVAQIVAETIPFMRHKV